MAPSSSSAARVTPTLKTMARTSVSARTAEIAARASRQSMRPSFPRQFTPLDGPTRPAISYLTSRLVFRPSRGLDDTRETRAHSGRPRDHRGGVTVKTAPIALGAALVLAAGLIAGPDSAWARRSGGGGGARGAVGASGGGRAFASTSSGIPPALINGGVGGGPRVFGTLPGPRPAVNINQGFGHGFHHHKFFRPFFPFGIVAAAPAVVYAAPYYYPPDYYP